MSTLWKVQSSYISSATLYLLVQQLSNSVQTIVVMLDSHNLSYQSTVALLPKLRGPLVALLIASQIQL